MTGDEQQANGGNGASGNASPVTPNGSANPNETVEYWKTQAETLQNRYNGQQAAMTKKADEVKSWQQKYAETQAELEGYKGTTTSELADWQKKHQTVADQAVEQAKKLAQYELKDRVRSLINSDDFKELANDFESDPIYQSGVLSAAAGMDEAGLKEALAKSLTTRKGRQSEAEKRALSGATSPAPTGGQTAAASEEEIIAQLNKTAFGSPEYDLLMNKWQEARNRKP